MYRSSPESLHPRPPLVSALYNRNSSYGQSQILPGHYHFFLLLLLLSLNTNFFFWFPRRKSGKKKINKITHTQVVNENDVETKKRPKKLSLIVIVWLFFLLLLSICVLFSLRLSQHTQTKKNKITDRYIFLVTAAYIINAKRNAHAQSIGAAHGPNVTPSGRAKRRRTPDSEFMRSYRRRN